MELFYPVIVNDDIYIIPNSDNMRDKYELNLSYIDFNPSSFSYLLIMSEEPIHREELENLAKKVISMLTILILNPLYLEEYYHFKYEGGNFSLVEAIINPFEEPDLKKKRNQLHGRLSIFSFNKITRGLFQKISNNPISDFLYIIIMWYITSHREPLTEISGTIAWNVIEHTASRYWKSLRRHRRAHIIKKIFMMFDNEHIEYESKRDLIKDMYKIRNKIYHEGLSLAEIENLLGKNPINVIVSFKPFLYRKILEFVGFISEFLDYVSGHLIIKKELELDPNILEREPEIKIKLDEYKLVKELKSLDNLLERLIGTALNTFVKDEDKDYEATAIISKREGEYIIKFLDPPRIFHFGFDKLPSKVENYPEDIIKYLRSIICTFTDDNIQYEIEFYNRPIDTKIKIKSDQFGIRKWVAEQYGKEMETEEEVSEVDFKINKINLKKL
ncbi:MAG: hypothetical protein KJI71_02150 [Patescibacteria group bacterium]|nr:hypothetical protein [Patescibacteria group bacterium]